MRYLLTLCVFGLGVATAISAQDNADPCLNRNVVIKVTDGKWHTLSHLNPANFRATVDGQPISVTSCQEIVVKRVIMLVDASGSMHNSPGADSYRLGLELAERMVPYIRPDILFAVYAFNIQLKQILALSDPPGQLTNAIDQLPPEWQQAKGRTALWGSVDTILSSIPELGMGDAVVVYSDSGDNRNPFLHAAVKARLLHRGVRLFGILIPPDHLGRTPEEARGPEDFKEVAERTGGELLVAQIPKKGTTWREDDVKNLLGQIENAYQLQLTLHSVPNKDPRWKLQLQNVDKEIAKQFHIFYPEKLAACSELGAGHP